MIFAINAPLCVFASSEADARLALAAAQSEITDCYTVASEAENAGANITGLLGNLSDAGALLSKANLAYINDDFNSSIKLALLTQARLNGFVEEANALRDAAKQRVYLGFMVNVVGSLVGAGAVIVGSFFLWYFLKRKYSVVKGVV